MTQQNTQPPAETLAECPFCGGAAELKGANAPEYWVACPGFGCKATTEGFGSKGRAIAAWNRRAALAGPAGGDAQQDTVAFVQEWLMNADYDPTQFDKDFAAAIDARTGKLTSDEWLTAVAERFCATPLPNSVCADPCARHTGPGRTGTNLLTVLEAREMLRQAIIATPGRAGGDAILAGEVEIRAITAQMRRFMPNACGDWADKIDAALETEKGRKVAFYDEGGIDIRPGESLADRDRRIYQQGRHDALNDEPEAFI